MKRSTNIVVAIVVPCLGLLGLATLILVGPPGAHFVCHRALDGALVQWMLETTNEVWFPNAGGSSSQSLALLIPYLHEERPSPLRDYRYVPGLRSDDPEDLILFYIREPSRRTWHGDTHWFRRDKKWVVLNPRMSTPDDVDARGWSELGEAVSTEKFKARLKATLEYLKSKGRSGWQAASEEHMRFLSAIRE